MALRKLAKDHVEVFLSIAAVITAIAAVVIALEQTKVMREEASLERQAQRIAVMPSVWISTHITEENGVGEFKFVFSNRGLGPAVIERFNIFVAGEEVKNWDKLARMMAAKFDSSFDFENRYVKSERSPISAGMFLEAGLDAVPFSFSSEDDEEAYQLFVKNAYKLNVSLCYCSLFGECYEARLFKRPNQIEQCEADPQPFVSHAFFKE